EFAALDYRTPVQNKYAYIMEGLDKDWIYVDAGKRFASYTTLGAGKYVFRVKAANNDGLWNEQGTAIRIRILPPFWQTWYFILGCILLSTAIVGLIVWQRVRALLAIERVRTKIAADLHDNIGAGLTEISILGELVQNQATYDSKGAQEIIAKMCEIARSLIDGMNDIVWLIHPHRDTLYDLVLKLKDTYHDLFQAKGILFKTSDVRVLENVHLPMDYRHQLYLLLKEAMNNCIKHSRCTQVTLTITAQNRRLILSLADNGQGISGRRQSDCDGLDNMKKRAMAIGGKLLIQSDKNIGTVVTFVGDLNKRTKYKITAGGKRLINLRQQ
ncbi:hypothetical protein JXO59_09390, partial [candidate division KSB1 bacterium]|nr:hypothetical protein [candidate division KSB1 bacterium]